MPVNYEELDVPIISGAGAGDLVISLAGAVPQTFYHDQKFSGGMCYVLLVRATVNPFVTTLARLRVLFSGGKNLLGQN